jgi:RNA polymerase sigma factor (sigma-70 family)
MRADEFERLYAEHASDLFAFLAYRTGSAALAEDLLADTFERALRARFRFDRRRGSQRAWLYSIALNLARDQARRRAAEGRAVERAGARIGAGGPPDPAEDAASRLALVAALDELSSEEREAVALRFGADLTVPEIARLTKQPLTTVEGRVYRALRKLRESWPDAAR